MIKFYFRKSIFYFLIYEIIYYVRFMETKFMDFSFSFNDSGILTFLMALGEIFGGFIFFLIVHNSFKKNKKTDYFQIQLIKVKSSQIRKDGWTKIIILIFLAAFFDYIQFVISDHIIFQTDDISKSINQRYYTVQILTSFLI